MVHGDHYMVMKKVKLLVADKSTKFRYELISILKDIESIEIVGESHTGIDVIKKVSQFAPDIIVMDIDLPILNGISTLSKIKKTSPKTKIIIVTLQTDQATILRAIKEGADSYIEKNCFEENIFIALNAVFDNNSYLSPFVCKLVIDSIPKSNIQPQVENLNELSVNEKELLNLIVENNSNEIVTRDLSISLSSIKENLKNVMEKLGVCQIGNDNKKDDDKDTYTATKEVSDRKTVHQWLNNDSNVEDVLVEDKGNSKKVRLSDIVRENTIRSTAPIKPDESKIIKSSFIDVKSKNIIKKQQNNTDSSKFLLSGNEIDLSMIYCDAFNYIKECSQVVKKQGMIDIEMGLDIVSQIVKNSKNIDILLGKTLSLVKKGEHLICNMINVAVIVIKLGISLNLSIDKLKELGLAGMLHDIGMFMLPENIIKKVGLLSSSEREDIMRHPGYSSKIIEQHGNDYLWLADTLAQHHERHLGQGYPDKLKGGSIKEYAKLIGIADVYVALTNGRPDRNRLVAFEAISKLVVRERDLHDPLLMKLLVKTISWYPIESYVKLNSCAIGKVIELNEKSHLRPTVELVFDCEGNIIKDKRIINLEENQSALYIMEPVLEEHLIFK